MKHLDFSEFHEMIEEFYAREPYCVEHKLKLSEHTVKYLFKFLDTDGNGELDFGEVHVFRHRMIGECRHAKAKEDGKLKLQTALKKAKRFLLYTTGIEL